MSDVKKSTNIMVYFCYGILVVVILIGMLSVIGGKSKDSSSSTPVQSQESMF
jgi:hypothetical protein